MEEPSQQELKEDAGISNIRSKSTVSSSEFEISFGVGKIGMALETDLFHENVFVKSIEPDSLASTEPRLVPGLVIVAVNGYRLEGVGYDITLAKIKDAANKRDDGQSMTITFRKASDHYKEVEEKQKAATNDALSPSHLDKKIYTRGRSRSYTDRDEDRLNMTKIREKARSLERTQSISYDQIALLKKNLRAERAKNKRSKEKIQMLVCNQQLLSSGVIHQASDKHVNFSLRLLAGAFTLSAICAVIPEQSWYVTSYYVPEGFALDEWLSVAVAGVLTYAHFHLAMCQAQDRNIWTSNYGVIFVILLFMLNEGHGIYLATSALDEAQREMLTGLRYSNDVKFIVCAQKLGDVIQSCRSDTLTWPLMYFMRTNFSNYLLYGANLGLMYFTLKMENTSADAGSRIVRKLSVDLKYVLYIIHGLGLAAMGVVDHVVPVTVVFCLLVLKSGGMRLNTNRMVQGYLSRVSIVTLTSLLAWYVVPKE